MLIMLVSSIGSAQTFDFSCGPDANGITTHDGFEMHETITQDYRNDEYEVYVSVFDFSAGWQGRIVDNRANVLERFSNNTTAQEAYDLAVAWVLENRTPIPTETCTTTLSIAEGAAYDLPQHAVNNNAVISGVYIDVLGDGNSSDDFFPNGSDLPTGEFEYRLYTAIGGTAGAGDVLTFPYNEALGGTSRIHDGSCELVINGDTERVKIRETFVINIPEALNPWIQRITFQDIQNNSIKHTPDVGGNETNIYDDGDFIPEEATHYRIRIRRTLGTNNGSYETEQISVPSSGDLNVCLSVVDIQDGLRIVNPNSSDEINGIFIGADYYSNGAIIPPGPHTNVRVSSIFNGRSYPYIDHAFNIGEECGNIVITEDTYSTFECSITLDIADGLYATTGNHPITGIEIGGVNYLNGSIIPSGSHSARFLRYRSTDNAHVPATIPVFNFNATCGVVTIGNPFTHPVQQVLLGISPDVIINQGGDLSGTTYSLAGKTYTISNESSGQYRFTPNSGNVIFVDKAGLTASGGRIIFNKVDLWNSGGHALTTNGTEELERAIPLIEVGVKIFYPSGRGNYNSIRNGEPLFAIESDFLVTDAANMNKNIIDLTPVNGITVFPGDENAITSGGDFSALVTESRYYAYVLTNNKIGVGLVTGSGASLVITDTENNLKIGSARGGTLLWEINGPRRINDVGEFKYIKVVNQRHSSWDDVEGYYRIHPAINGGFTDRTSETYLAAATSGDLTGGTTIDPDTIDDQTVVGDVFVVRDNSTDRQGFTVGSVRSKRTGGTVYGIIFSFGAPNLGTSLNFNVGHAQKLTNTPVLQ